MKALYRIIAALAAVLVFPALYFQKLIHCVIDLGFTEGYFDDEFSIQDIVTFFGDKSNGFSLPEITGSVAKTLAPLKPSAVVTAVFLALTIVMVFAVIICSAFTNARKVNLVFSLVGAASALGAIAAFNHMTGIIIDGTVALGDIVNAFLADSGSTLGGIAALFGIGSAVSFIGDLVLLRLDSAIVTTLIIFIFITIWTTSFILIDMEPDKADLKKRKRRNKG